MKNSTLNQVKILLIFVLFLFAYKSEAQQKKYYLKFYDNNTISIKSFADSIQLNNFLRKKQQKLLSKGYIDAGYDSINYQGDTIVAYFSKSKKYYFGKIKFSDKEILPVYASKFFKPNKKLSNNNFEESINEILGNLENNGYPFATLSFDSVTFSGNKINAIVNIDKGKLITLDSILIKGNTNTHKKYFELYLKIKEGDNYNEKLLTSIDKKLRNLSFIQIKKPSNLLFYNNKVKLQLFVDKKKLNRFDGIVGIVPNDKVSGKLAVTGELKLFLKNSFGRGEEISAEWKKNDQYSQKLNISFKYPYIFNTILGVNTGFKFLKQDTSYLNIDMLGGIDFIVNYNSHLTLFAEQKKTVLLSVEQILNTNTLPEYAGNKTNLFGINLSVKNLDRIYSPHRGFFADIKLAGGIKYIDRDNRLPDELYQGIPDNTKHIESTAEMSVYLPLSRRIIFSPSAKMMYINDEKLFTNDLYRFGGLKTLRGFNEDELYADFVSIGSVQLNYFFEEYSSFFVFCDFAYYENHVSKFIHDTPFGFGAGTNFSTKAGIFSVSYALGKQFDNPILFNSALIHIGYISVF